MSNLVKQKIYYLGRFQIFCEHLLTCYQIFGTYYRSYI